MKVYKRCCGSAEITTITVDKCFKDLSRFYQKKEPLIKDLKHAVSIKDSSAVYSTKKKKIMSAI